MLIPWSRGVRFSALGNSRRYWQKRIAIRSTPAKGSPPASRGLSVAGPLFGLQRPKHARMSRLSRARLAEAAVLRTALSRADLAGPFCSSLKLPAQGTGRRSCPALHERATCSIRGVLPVCLILRCGYEVHWAAGPRSAGPPSPDDTNAASVSGQSIPAAWRSARYDVPGSAERAEERHIGTIGHLAAVNWQPQWEIVRPPVAVTSSSSIARPCLERPERPGGRSTSRSHG